MTRTASIRAVTTADCAKAANGRPTPQVAMTPTAIETGQHRTGREFKPTARPAS